MKAGKASWTGSRICLIDEQQRSERAEPNSSALFRFRREAGSATHFLCNLFHLTTFCGIISCSFWKNIKSAGDQPVRSEQFGIERL